MKLSQLFCVQRAERPLSTSVDFAPFEELSCDKNRGGLAEVVLKKWLYLLVGARGKCEQSSDELQANQHLGLIPLPSKWSIVETSRSACDMWKDWRG